MAAENPPYAIQADSHGAELFRLAVASLLPQGVGGLTAGQGGIVLPTDLAVSQGAGNTVHVAAGSVWVPGNQGPHQGLYYCYNDAQVSLAVTPNASQPLVALVTASVNDQGYPSNPGVTANQWGLLVTQGTPAASPAIPAVPNNSVVLATLSVPPNASGGYQIVQGLASSISGTTLTGPIGQTTAATLGAPAGLMNVTTAFAVANTTVTQVGNFTTAYLRGGMLGPAGGNKLVVPVAGLYGVSGSLGWTTHGSSTAVQTNRTITQILQNGAIVLEWEQFVGGVAHATVGNSGLVECAAGDVFTVSAFQSAGATADVYSATGYSYLAMNLESY